VLIRAKGIDKRDVIDRPAALEFKAFCQPVPKSAAIELPIMRSTLNGTAKSISAAEMPKRV